jgi:hypothetical protein
MSEYGDREPDPDPWKENDLLRLEMRNLRLENAYYRQQLAAMRTPLYMSGRWVRQAGSGIQPQIPRN